MHKNTPKSFWTHHGKAYFLISLIYPAILFTFWLFNNLQFRNEYRLQTAMIFLFINSALTISSLAMFAIGKHKDTRLKKLQKSGKSHTPIKTALLSGFDSQHLPQNGTADSFRVKCTFANPKGNEFAITSGILVISSGLFKTTPINQHNEYKATIYTNPKKPHIHAISIKFPSNT